MPLNLTTVLSHNGLQYTVKYCLIVRSLQSYHRPAAALKRSRPTLKLMNVTEAEAAPSTCQFDFSSNNEASYNAMAVPFVPWAD